MSEYEHEYCVKCGTLLIYEEEKDKCIRCMFDRQPLSSVHVGERFFILQTMKFRKDKK